MTRPQLHLVTDPDLPALEQVRRIEAASPHGVDAVHTRLPGASGREVYELAIVLRNALTGTGTWLAVNDRVDVALAVNAGGIQLGTRSLPLPAVRRVVGPHAPVGVSVHSVEEARAAERDGATWVTFGHIFETASHCGDPGRGVEALRQVVEAVSVPVIAIGGITPERVGSVMASGAAGIAVISGILHADDVAAASRAYREALDGAMRLT
jgi:thiamine-phosphate diphosphorylase